MGGFLSFPPPARRDPKSPFSFKSGRRGIPAGISKKVRTAPDPDSDIIFEADESLLQIITKLNEKEALFSTVYLEPAFQDGKAYTWWGNYGKQYVVFESVE